MQTSTTEDEDFFDELPTAVLVRRLIDEALVETECPAEEAAPEVLDPAEFRAIGTR